MADENYQLFGIHGCVVFLLKFQKHLAFIQSITEIGIYTKKTWHLYNGEFG